MNRYYFNTILLMLVVLIQVSCKKYLDVKPNKALVVPSSLKDLQALLEFEPVNNTYLNLPLVASDDYYLTSSMWSACGIEDRDAYLWAPDAMYSAWAGYHKVYNANVVLQELSKMKSDNENQSEYNYIKGQALFHRAYAFYYLAQLYCRPYTTSAASDPGIALRLVPDIEEPSTRASVQDTYDRIITDLKEAMALLPDWNAALNRPNKMAVFGALSRTYLSMRDYTDAGKYADSALTKNNSLIDFNSLSAIADVPIGQFNAEVIFYALLDGISLPFSRARIDTSLYQLYDNNDLRKVVFFKPDGFGYYVFKGGYTPAGWLPFYGIATDEMYLTRAECSARAGLKDSAMADLNKLMVTRWKNDGSFVPFTASTVEEAKNKILLERRKELVYRGHRWSDVRRLNLEGADITFTRIINGTTYTLPPNDLRWVWLIPAEVIAMTGMPQNSR